MVRIASTTRPSVFVAVCSSCVTVRCRVVHSARGPGVSWQVCIDARARPGWFESRPNDRVRDYRTSVDGRVREWFMHKVWSWDVDSAGGPYEELAGGLIRDRGDLVGSSLARTDLVRDYRASVDGRVRKWSMRKVWCWDVDSARGPYEELAGGLIRDRGDLVGSSLARTDLVRDYRASVDALVRKWFMRKVLCCIWTALAPR